MAYNAEQMKRIIKPTKREWAAILERPTVTVKDVEATVDQIFSEIKRNGDVAVSKYTRLFDGIKLNQSEAGKEEFEAAEASVSEALKRAIQVAMSNIEKFHRAQVTKKLSVETSPGVQCWIEKRAIQKVGLYIPGGSAPLFSTLLMLAIPARIAGCEDIVVCTPPDKEGAIHPAILYTARLCGVTKVYKVGGIQAIGALTFGTDTIPKVDKIFGPGNQFVTVAKQLATKFGVAIDMPAGPSELLVFADDSANSSFVASDLLSQAEHGADSQVILVTTSEKIMNEVAGEIAIQMKTLPRKSIAERAIQNSKLILMASQPKALELINDYGPEHLIIVSDNENYFVNGIRNAGSIFLGNYTPESAGDYASGTNHTLPTNGFAKQYSGVNLDSFLKAMTFQKITKEGLQSLGPTIEEMASAEGLEAHKRAVTIRLAN